VYLQNKRSIEPLFIKTANILEDMYADNGKSVLLVFAFSVIRQVNSLFI
jgi:hypothetical protein